MRSFLKNLWRWVRENVRWIASASPVWGTLAVVTLVAAITSFLPGEIDDRVRYCGMTLELLGVFTVASGLREKRRLFKRPSLLEHLQHWLGRRPRWGVRTQTILATGAGSISASGSAKISVWRGVAPDATLEVRVAAIEANLETLRSELAETAKQLQEETRNRTEALDSERHARESSVCALQTQLDTFGAGGLHLEAAGLFWLVLGVVLATTSTEVAWILTWNR